MNSLSQLFASAVGINNENSLALASAKFDFTLVKFEAPAEYARFGSSLSLARREEAEDGPIHRTARRLAALFEQKTPSAPKLTSSYGVRVSEIINKPDVNPSGSPKDGPFARFVGADGRAVWAAATSGSGALGVCLLALLLAKTWNPNDSVAIWVDIVKARKLEIRTSFQQNDVVSEGALMSTLQEVSRSDLRLWDSSARSWLQSADRGKPWELKQLELTTRDLGVPFGASETTYENVMSAWRIATDCLENLLKGHPQKIYDQVVLKAISAWHLFPNLLLLREQTVSIPFKDSLFPGTAVATIGLELADVSRNGGVRWSLALSHLQYYGAPVEVESQIGTPKVTITQLRMVVLGALFAKWNVNHRQHLELAKCMVDLWSLLSEAASSPPVRKASHHLSWLYPLVQASQDLVTASKKSDAVFSDAKRLISYGERRGTTFFGEDSPHLEPFFGLCNVHVIAGLRESSDIECGISFLRSIAEHSGLQAQEGFVLSSHWLNVHNRSEPPEFYEHVTLTPAELILGSGGEKTNIRWLQGASHERSRDESSSATHKILSEKLQEARIANAQERNEHFEQYDPGTGKPRHLYHQTKSDFGKVGSVLEWINPPDLFRSSSAALKEIQPRSLYDSPQAKRKRESSPSRNDPHSGDDSALFTCVEGGWDCGLYLRDSTRRLSRYDKNDYAAAISALTASANKVALWNYICGVARVITMPISLNVDVGISLLTKGREIDASSCNSLHALSAADDVFKSIRVPTISLECISRPFGDIPWKVQSAGIGERHFPLDPIEKERKGEFLPLTLPKLSPGMPGKMTREEAFACVVYLDSGRIELDPKHLKRVLAVSSDNSLYIAGIILSDPANTVIPSDIRRLTGNIGRAGISLLIAPKEPAVRTLKHDYRVVMHCPYDSRREDNFEDTSMHLSFTNWVQPLDTGGDRFIDSEVNFVESVIAVHERGAWVADLDILAIELEKFPIISSRLPCHGHYESALTIDYTSIDSWDELLDGPTSVGILRAHQNWAARLAAVNILCQERRGHAVGLLDHNGYCLQCIEKLLTLDRRHFGPYESGLPSICID